jgi:hypothetical protein
MTDDDDPECLICGKVWATFRTFDGTRYVLERHNPDCPARPVRATLLPEPGPQGDAA